MRGIFNIILATLVLIGSASCVVIDTHLKVGGYGQLNANSNFDIAKDYISATGEQSYDRYYLDKGSRKILVTNYNLTKSSANGSRTYAISATFPEGISHNMKLTSKSTMSTINYVDSDAEKGYTTKYRASTSGTLEENIINMSAVYHPKFIAELAAKGDISFATSITSNETSRAASDLVDLLKKVDSVPMNGLIAQVQVPRLTTKFTFGDKTITVTEGSTGSFSVGQTKLLYNIDPTSDINEEDRIMEIKKKGISESRVLGPYRIIEEVPNAEYLDVDISPNEAEIGDIVDFRIKLYKGGDARLYRVSATAKLPKQMDFVGSPYGVCKNGVVGWKDIGPLNSNQSTILTFRARINDYAANLSSLNITASAEGIYQDGEPLQGDETVTLSVKQSLDNTVESSSTTTPTENETNQSAVSEGANKIVKESDGNPFSKSISSNLSAEEPSRATSQNSSGMRLRVMSADLPKVYIEKTANTTLMNEEDNKVTYDIAIKNIGTTTLTEVSVDDKLPEEMVYIKGSASPPEDKFDEAKGEIRWDNVGPIETNQSIKLTYDVNPTRINNTSGDKLINHASVHAKDAAGNWANGSISSTVIFQLVSESHVFGDYKIVTDLTPSFAVREPLVRDAVHIGQYLKWDAMENVGRKSLYRIPYFVKDIYDPNYEKIKGRQKTTLYIGDISNDKNRSSEDGSS